jgi:Type IV secretion system pilin
MKHYQSTVVMFFYSVLASIPCTVAAADPTLVSVIDAAATSLGKASGLLVSIALMVFLWGVVQFIGTAGDEKARGAGRTKILWGLIGLALIVSVWGVVNLLRTMVGTNAVTKCNSPKIDITVGSVKTTECL